MRISRVHGNAAETLLNSETCDFSEIKADVYVCVCVGRHLVNEKHNYER